MHTILLTGATGRHAVVFRGWLRRIARRAERKELDLFVYRSIVPARAADVFRWHERPEALTALLPHTSLLRIEERVGGVRDGGRVTFSVGIGPLRLRWQARHFGFVPDVQFCDEQVRGPFAFWRHTHRVQPIADDRTLYEDRVEYAVPGGRWINALAAPLVRRVLARSFAVRHRVVRERVLAS
jgi:ligand-binding SRPBCC domain-containing protein